LIVTPNNFLVERIGTQLEQLIPANSSIMVGLSGGVDSVVLLHLLYALVPRFSWQLSALHVHHGISPNADAWAEFCADQCAELAVPLHIEHVDIAPLRSHGIEAAARKLRHTAFAMQSCDYVALAHHAEDQAETLLLQLLRGAGVRGASAMPVLAAQTGSPRFVRPLLYCSRQEIVDYATAHRLDWIEDESNADDSFPRNFLRHRVLPLLGERFPAYRDTLVRSAQHFAEAGALLDELAQQDAAQAIESGRLSVSTLRSLSVPRAKNLIRYFLHGIGVPMPQAVQLDDMLQQLCGARQDSAICITFGEWEVRRYQGNVHVLRALGKFDRSHVLPWNGETQLDWPALNAHLQFNHLQGAGISLAKMREEPVTLRLRQGGETLRPHPKSSTRTVKNLLQEHHIPPWQRDRLPLLYCGDKLICVVGVVTAAEYQASNNEEGLLVSSR
jgi:tRNA(Ile)-lysidine synthase